MVIAAAEGDTVVNGETVLMAMLLLTMVKPQQKVKP
jgi:hypothetical protein